MPRLSLLLALLLCSASSSAQWAGGYQHFAIRDRTLGAIRYHVRSDSPRKEKPLLIWLQGSGCQPLFSVVDDGKKCCYYLSSVMINADSLARTYHVVLISKPGIPFADTVRVANVDSFDMQRYGEEHLSGPACGEDYNRRLSLGWRAGAVARVVDDAVKRVPVNAGRILVAGHSEGAPVAARAAVLNRKITHVACLAGPGLTQFYDFVLAARKRAFTGEQSPEESQADIDTLLADYRRMAADPTSTTRFWQGHTYRRWMSFTEPMAEALLKLDIPVFVAAGTHDMNTLGENADFIPVLFAQRGKTNLTYRACLHCDHGFTDTRNGKNYFGQYLGAFLAAAEVSPK